MSGGLSGGRANPRSLTASVDSGLEFAMCGRVPSLFRSGAFKYAWWLLCAGQKLGLGHPRTRPSRMIHCRSKLRKP